MIRIEDLEKIGISRFVIDIKTSTDDLEIIDDSVIVHNNNFYDEVFLKCLNNSDMYKTILDCMDESDIKRYYSGVYEILFGDIKNARRLINSVDDFNQDVANFKIILNGEHMDNSYPRYNEYLERFVALLDKYINDCNYLLCSEVIDLIMTYDNCFYLSVLKVLVTKLEDKIEYIADPLYYRNKVVLENYYKFERKLFFKLEMGLIEEVAKINDDMKYLYQDQSPLVFDIINLMITKIRMLNNNRRFIASHNEMGVVGDFDSVLIMLFTENDFYRVIELVNRKYKENPHSIKLNMYKKLTDIMKFYLDRNNEFIKAEMELRTVSDITVEEIVGPYPLSSISGELLSNVESTNEDYIDDNINYYELYRESLEKKDYRSALDAIRKFQLKLRRLGSNVSFDYIEKDMMIRIENSTNDKKNIEKYEYYLGFANKYRKEGEYEKAICYYYDAFKYCIKRNPILLCKVAECYVGLDDYLSAIKMYEVTLKDYMYPEDILKYMDVLLKHGDYGKVIEVSKVYESYYPLDNPRVHYMLSICFIHLRDYGEAIAELWMTENINNEVYGATYELVYEANIIKKLEAGEEVIPYDMSTFVDFEMSDYDKKVKKRYDKYEEIVNDPLGSIFSTIGTDEDTFDNKMNYLFSLLKIFILNNEEGKAKKVYSFIGEFIEKTDEPENVKNKFTLSLKNYRNL